MTMAAFKELHYVGSALAIIAACFPVVGTTCFGVSASAGTPGVRQFSKPATLAHLAQLGTLGVHVTADSEDGCSQNFREVPGLVATCPRECTAVPQAASCWDMQAPLELFQIRRPEFRQYTPTTCERWSNEHQGCS